MSSGKRFALSLSFAFVPISLLTARAAMLVAMLAAGSCILPPRGAGAKSALADGTAAAAEKSIENATLADFVLGAVGAAGMGSPVVGSKEPGIAG